MTRPAGGWPPPWWPRGPEFAAAARDAACQRPCGCFWDVTVFGHWPGYCQGCGGGDD